MTARLVIALPLPECLLCARPTRRDVHTANGGLCSDCRALVEDDRPRR